MSQLTKISDATVGGKIADATPRMDMMSKREGVGVEEASPSPKIRHLVKIDRMLISSHSLTLVPNGTRVSNVETDNTYPFASIEAIGVVGGLPEILRLIEGVPCINAENSGVAGGGIRTLQLAIRQLPEYVSKRGLVS